MATKILKLYKTEENEDECCYQNENFTQYQSNDYNQFFIKQCDNRLLIKYSRDCIKSSCYAKKLKMTQNSRNNLYAFLYGIIVSIFQISNSKSLRTQSFPRSSRSFSIMPTQYLPIIVLVFLQLNCLLSCSRFGLVMANKIDVLANELEYDSNILPTGHFTHTWAVHIPNGDSGLADRVAEDHGFMNMGKIIGDHYHFIHHKVAKRSLTPSDHHQSRLHNDDRVHWSSQQLAKSRQKRDFIRMRPSRTSSKAMSLVDSIQLNDPKWSQMWYLNRGGGLDMNVIPAWKEGITGKGVVVTILDDGLESDHPDIEQNYDPKASYDVNSHDEDPMPHYDMTDSNRHGTRCAGEVAATANNTICAVGIAFGASVGGVRMLDGDVTDAVEARSLSLNPSHIDIYSASWGPDDDGKTVDGPGELASRAFIEGVNNGRKGKGSIFIWASGNGGRELDNCNCDGYTNSIWTLSISSATEEGHVPWYSEKCSSTLATTYSSGGQGEKQVVTTDLHHSCTVSHTGTSASAPLAAGIAALALEANGNLTWRDLQHIVVRTAKPANLKDTTWSRNGVGRRVSHSFGYGLMDAAGMVKAARTWKTVPEQQRCEINAPHVDKFIPPRSYITLRLVVKHCSSVNFLEHVQAKITLTSQRRGDIQLFLTSPAGTKVTLLTSRIHDVSRSGFSQWPFMSVHTWGEAPQGDWQLEIHNEGRFMAQITQWDLIFYGTEKPAQPDDPIHISPAQVNSYGSDIEHNGLEYDSDTASGQWRDMHQVGESRADIQRMANDQTNSACQKFAYDQRCIECAITTILFKDRCYLSCPDRFFVTTTEVSKDQKNDDIANLNEFQEMKAKTLMSDRRRCESCHSSCLRCKGVNVYECTSCFSGSQLRIISSNESYCYVFAERSSGSNKDISDSHKINATGIDGIVFLIVLLPIAALLILAAYVFIFGKGLSWTGKRVNYVYDRVSLQVPDEEIQFLTNDINDDENDAPKVNQTVKNEP